MKVVYPICCGNDVHKSFLIAIIITTKSGELAPQYQKNDFQLLQPGSSNEKLAVRMQML